MSAVASQAPARSAAQTPASSKNAVATAAAAPSSTQEGSGRASGVSGRASGTMTNGAKTRSESMSVIRSSALPRATKRTHPTIPSASARESVPSAHRFRSTEFLGATRGA